MNILARLTQLDYSAAHLPEYLAPALDLGLRLKGV